MSRTVVITQPTYMPWLGYFEQISRADVFIFLDTVQFVQRSWHSRNRLKGSNGQPFWLTVPVVSHAQKTPLLDIKISPHQSQWREKHLSTIQTYLGSTPYFAKIFPLVQSWLNTEHTYLVDLNISGIKLFSQFLGLSPQFMKASDLMPNGNRTQLLLNLCQQVGATSYYTSAGSSAYMAPEEHLFADAGIELKYQSWEHPVYSQWGSGFTSHLSALDVFANIGADVTRSYILPTDSKEVTS
ncbi:WbqC family protein [Neosynechococcus sphagnicola]|uniref:WbqC family protein n=1 Tax=Neosynechococcus sphagnicola TaxID=1501145 RepID=UPI000907D606|nr:WbqC family protein [Neosynechococcus sphagnicola]